MNRALQGELDGALTAVIDDMRQAVDQLAEVLDVESAALRARNSETLDQAGTRKQALMLQLEHLDAERLQLSREAPATAAMLEPAWTQILQSLRHCQQLNQRNGSTVALLLNQVRQALSVLTGHAGENELYERTGEVRTTLRSQMRAQA